MHLQIVAYAPMAHTHASGMEDLKELIEVFAEIDSFEEMNKLFKELFTVKEIYDVALRWRLMKDLHRKVPQREIAHDLGISLCKITRGSKILKNESSQCRKIIGNLLDEKES